MNVSWTPSDLIISRSLGQNQLLREKRGRENRGVGMRGMWERRDRREGSLQQQRFWILPSAILIITGGLKNV